MDNRNNNFRLVIIYKLLYDVLFLLLLVFAALMIADSLLPGFLSGHLSFTKIIFLIFVNLLLIFYFDKKINTSQKNETPKKPGKYFLSGLVVFMILLIIVSLLKFSWSSIAVITSTSLLVAYYLYKSTRNSN